MLLFSLVFRWIFIPWLQAEMDAYRDRVNSTRKRKDKNKVLPHGVPNDMFENSEDYGALDFKVIFSLEKCLKTYAYNINVE